MNGDPVAAVEQSHAGAMDGAEVPTGADNAARADAESGVASGGAGWSTDVTAEPAPGESTKGVGAPDSAAAVRQHDTPAAAPRPGTTSSEKYVQQNARLEEARAAVTSVTGITEEDMETLAGLHFLGYGHSHRVTAQRAGFSRPAVERQFVRFADKTRHAEDFKDLSSVYFGEDGYEEAQAQLEEAMQAQCYEKVKVVKGVRKRQLVRIYFDAERGVFTQAKGDDKAFNKKFPWAFQGQQ